MEVSVESIKALREETGAGIMDCKRALTEACGDLDKARDSLKEKGMATARKKAARTTNQGIVDSYIHSGGRIGALVEVNCETDFVARTDEFKALVHDIAMQVAAMAPQYVDVTDIPECKDKAAEELNPEEVCLLKQPFIKDPSKSIQDLVNEAVGKIGENIRIRRFVRFVLGE